MAKILIVDDNADERLIYSAVLHYHGHEVSEAVDGKAGIDMARSTQPAVILMDVHLPVMNGLLAAEILKASPDTSDIPIVCLTGYDISRSHALESGCCQFLRKPVSPSELTQAVDSLLAEAQ